MPFVSARGAAATAATPVASTRCSPTAPTEAFKPTAHRAPSPSSAPCPGADKLTDAQSQIRSYVFDVVRATVPKMNLDDVFTSKEEIAVAVKSELTKSMAGFGFSIIQVGRGRRAVGVGLTIVQLGAAGAGRGGGAGRCRRPAANSPRRQAPGVCPPGGGCAQAGLS